MKYKKYYVQQLEEKDCGVAALGMILKFFGSDIAFTKIRSKTKTDKNGTTAFGLIKAAKIFNLSAEAIKADQTLFDYKELDFPFIAHVIKNNSILHYYVVFEFNHSEKMLIIGDPDPSVKIRKISLAEFITEWTGVALFFSPTPDYEPVLEQKSTLLSFLPVVFQQKKILTMIVVSSIVSIVISIIGSYYLQAVIDSFIPRKEESMLLIISVSLIFMYSFQQIIEYIKQIFLIILGQKLSKKIILPYIIHVFKLPMSFFETRKTGDIFSRFSDASKLVDAIGTTVMALVLDIWIIIIVSTVLAFQNINLFLITILTIPVYSVIILSFIKSFDKLNEEMMMSNSVVSSSIIEDFNGIETLKALSSESERCSKIDSEYTFFLEKSFKLGKLNVLQESLKKLLELLLNVVIVYVGAKYVISNVISLGQLITYTTLLVYFISPLQNILNLQSKLQTAKIANNRLNEVLLVGSEYENDNQLLDYDIDKLNGNITFQDVSFQYGYAHDILQNISLTIPLYSKIAIVGRSGSGKSTLVKLLIKYIEASSGIIKLNNIDLNEIKRENLRLAITYIPQQPYIFTGTIYQNLILGSRIDISKKEIDRACEIAEIKNEIEQFPLQYDTDITDNGGPLSGGQKQRISIARAILQESNIIILDESTSNLDSITEQKVISNLLTLENKTIIFVAHRLSIAKKTDIILVIEDGKIMEQGSHNELLKRKGIYHKLTKI